MGNGFVVMGKEAGRLGKEAVAKGEKVCDVGMDGGWRVGKRCGR